MGEILQFPKKPSESTSIHNTPNHLSAFFRKALIFGLAGLPLLVSYSCIVDNKTAKNIELGRPYISRVKSETALDKVASILFNSDSITYAQARKIIATNTGTIIPSVPLSFDCSASLSEYVVPETTYINSRYFRFQEQEARLNQNNPAILALAQFILTTSNAKHDPLSSAVAINRWIHVNFESETSTHPRVQNLSQRQDFGASEDIFKYRTGSCFDYAQAACALCRSIGIPSKILVFSAIAEADGRHSLIKHALTEVFINGKWLVLDPLNSENEYWNGFESYLAKPPFEYKKPFILGYYESESEPRTHVESPDILIVSLLLLALREIGRRSNKGKKAESKACGELNTENKKDETSTEQKAA